MCPDQINANQPRIDSSLMEPNDSKLTILDILCVQINIAIAEARLLGIAHMAKTLAGRPCKKIIKKELKWAQMVCFAFISLSVLCICGALKRLEKEGRPRQENFHGMINVKLLPKNASLIEECLKLSICLTGACRLYFNELITYA